MSRIPQRVKDKKKTEKSEKTGKKTPKGSDKSLDEELKLGEHKTGLEWRHILKLSGFIGTQGA